MNKIFKILILIAFSVFTSTNTSASNTFSITEKQSIGVKKISATPFSSLDNSALTRLNTALQKTGGQIHTEFGELLVKLSEGNTQVLARISGSSWENKLPHLVDDLANAPPFKTKLLEKPELVEAWEVLDDAQIGNAIKQNPVKVEFVDNYITNNPNKTQAQITSDINTQGYSAWKLANTGNSSIDNILDIAKTFDDNVLDIAEVGLKNWKTFENRVYNQLKGLYPNNKIGSQITLDITYIENGVTKVKTIIPDNLIQIEVNGVMKYKVIDAKTSMQDLVNKPDLISNCTTNQKKIYPLIDAGGTNNGITITKVEMRGQRAKEAFDNVIFNSGKSQIQLKTGVEFWVNTNNTDFTQFLIRQRIK